MSADGAATHSLGSGGFAGVFRNHKGEWTLGYNSAIALPTPLEAELKVISYSLKLAVQHGITMLEVESDSLEAIDALLTSIPILDNLIFECRYWLSQLQRWVLHHSCREQNQLADCMAKEGARTRKLGDVQIFVTPPVYVRNHLLSDLVGTVYTRKVRTHDSYSGRDVASGHFESVLYNSKCLELATLRC